MASSLTRVSTGTWITQQHLWRLSGGGNHNVHPWQQFANGKTRSDALVFFLAAEHEKEQVVVDEQGEHSKNAFTYLFEKKKRSAFIPRP